jgi:protein TonB
MRYAKVDKEVEKAKEGEITLDKDDLEYTSYLHSFKRRLETIWKYPETAGRDGIQGDVIIRFSIINSGKVEDISILKSSGYPILDDTAKQALLAASPFNPLPGNWKRDRFPITVFFMYRIVNSNLYME